jgi:hypothetical protein
MSQTIANFERDIHASTFPLLALRQVPSNVGQELSDYHIEAMHAYEAGGMAVRCNLLCCTYSLTNGKLFGFLAADYTSVAVFYILSAALTDFFSKHSRSSIFILQGQRQPSRERLHGWYHVSAHQIQIRHFLFPTSLYPANKAYWGMKMPEHIWIPQGYYSMINSEHGCLLSCVPLYFW